MTDDARSSSASQPGILHALRRPLYALGLLALVWLVFGQALPRLVFAPVNKMPVSERQSSNIADAKQQIATLSARIDKLEARLGSYEELMAAMPSSAPSQETTAPEAEPSISDERMTQLEAAVNALQINNAEASRTITLLVLFSRMQEKAARGEQFSSEHAALKQQLSHRPEATIIMDKLAPFATSGIIPSREALKYFEALVPQALRKNSGNRVVDNLQSLVTIRKVGAQPGDGDESIIARTEIHLQSGDMDAALQEALRLSPYARDALSPWLDAMSAAKTARALMADLQLALATTNISSAAHAPVGE